MKTFHDATHAVSLGVQIISASGGVLFSRRGMSAHSRISLLKRSAALCQTVRARVCLSFLLFLTFASFVRSQTPPTLIQEVISREYSINVGGEETRAFQEVASREVSFFIGDGAQKPYGETVSREVSVLVTTPQAPARIAQLVVVPTPTGESVTLSWSNYNQWAEQDVVRYDIFVSTRGFTNVSQMTRYTWVSGETFLITLTNLPAWEDHCFAVVAVDALGGFEPVVNYAAAYTIAREVASREFSLYVGDDAQKPCGETFSREVSVLVTTPQVPARITQLVVIPTPTGESVTLSWSNYNQWAEQDVVRYDIFVSTRGFTNVSEMTRYTWVPGETFSITLTNLPAWEDHCFAVVAVDALAGFEPVVNYAAAYTIAREVASREFSMYVGDDAQKPYGEVISREVSVLVATPEMPSPVTGLTNGFTAITSTNAYNAIDLDWSSYNEVAQLDVVRYRIYAGPTYYSDVTDMEPYGYAPAGAQRWTVSGLNAMGIYYLAVVAEDVLGQWNPVVRSVSAQASGGLLGEVRDLAVTCGANSLYFSWTPPMDSEAFQAGCRLYLGGSGSPVELVRTSTNYTATGLLPAHGYPFRITTVDKFGKESAGASLLAATLLPNPSASAYGFDQMVRLTWGHVEPNELVKTYAVYAATTNFTSVAGMMPVVTTRSRRADVSGLVNGVGYFFAVTTVNIAGGESTNVQTIVGTPNPVSSTYADLTTTNVVAPDRVYPGRSAAFGWRVVNAGVSATTGQDTTPVSAWSDRIILSSNKVLGDADDVIAGDVRHNGFLDSCANYLTNVMVQVPRISPGAYHVFIVVNISGDVYEGLDAWDNSGFAVTPLNIQLVMPPENQRTDALKQFTATNRPTASDLPAGLLSYALSQAPAGMSINPTNGLILWTPQESQAGSTNLVVEVVTDNGAPKLIETNSFEVIVNGIPPVITVAPGSLTRQEGGTAVFRVSALGTAPLRYQWLFDGAPLIDDGRISGSATDTLVISNLQPQDEGLYSVSVANLSGCALSSAGRLTVILPPAFSPQLASPTFRYQTAGSSNRLTLIGASFSEGTIVEAVSANGATHLASTITLNSTTNLSAFFAPGVLGAGTYSVRVSLPGGGWTVLTNSLTVLLPNSDVFLSNVSCTNATGTNRTLSFTIAGGLTNEIYELYCATNLAVSTNSGWVWLGQGVPGGTYTFTNLSLPSVFFRLGIGVDSDGDGLPDAYENLVSLTEPFNADTDGDGLPDAWELRNGLSPRLSESTRPGSKRNYTYDAEGKLISVGGTASGNAGYDEEGNLNHTSF